MAAGGGVVQHVSMSNIVQHSPVPTAPIVQPKPRSCPQCARVGLEWPARAARCRHGYPPAAGCCVANAGAGGGRAAGRAGLCRLMPRHAESCHVIKFWSVTRINLLSRVANRLANCWLVANRLANCWLVANSVYQPLPVITPFTQILVTQQRVASTRGNLLWTQPSSNLLRPSSVK
jgi:hypothetical protein